MVFQTTYKDETGVTLGDSAPGVAKFRRSSVFSLATEWLRKLHEMCQQKLPDELVPFLDGEGNSARTEMRAYFLLSPSHTLEMSCLLGKDGVELFFNIPGSKWVGIRFEVDYNGNSLV
jgi:hypothetical protein